MPVSDLFAQAAARARNEVRAADAFEFAQAARSAMQNDSAIASHVTSYRTGHMSAQEAMDAIIASVEHYAGFAAHERKFKDCYQGAMPLITWDYRLKERLL